MSYPARTSFADLARLQPTREHRGSDATLVDYHPSERHHTNEKGYDKSGCSYDYVPSKLQHESRRYSQVLRDESQHRNQNTPGNPPSCLKRAPRTYYSKGQPRYSDRRRQRARSVHFDPDEESRRNVSLQSRNNAAGYSSCGKGDPPENYDNYDYGFVNDEEELDDRYAPSEMKSRRGQYAEYPSTRLPGLPQPATTPQPPPDAAPYQFLVIPQKDKSPGLTKRFRKAFAVFSVDPDFAVLGCEAGRPTPRHLLVQEAEEDEIEEAKQEKQRREREERVLQSKQRREGARNTQIAEQRAQQSQSQTQAQPQQHSRPSQVQRGSSYGARIAEQYNHQNTRFRHYDDACQPSNRRDSMQPDCASAERNPRPAPQDE